MIMAISEFTPESLKQQLNDRERETFSPFATRSSESIRRVREQKIETDYRQPFSIDADRILNSLAYTRYIDKTQVFSLIRNDHITHRVLHVQFVSKIGRTIGRALGLNEDLIEAIAIGHDTGHTPFGHDGEAYLSELCIENSIGGFHHNVQSVHFLSNVERKGKGWNLSLQTLDGILSHNGEIHDHSLSPEKDKTFEKLDSDINRIISTGKIKVTPMTLEGCLVRMVDTISYIGRDIEDAIRLNMLDRKVLPLSCTKILGRSNGTMVYNLVTDIIKNSIGQDRISYSEEVSTALKNLKVFNLKNIYLNPSGKSHLVNVKDLFKILFERYLSDLEKGNEDSVIVTNFLSKMSDEYKSNYSHAEIVRDFIAGMTDMYFLEQCPDDKKPKILTR